MRTRLLFPALLFILLPFSLFSQSGSLSDSWRPGSSDCGPEVDVSINYTIDGDSTGVNVSIRGDWNLSSTIYCEGNIYNSGNTSSFRVTNLDITAEVYAGSTCIGRISTDLSSSSTYSTSYSGRAGFKNGDFKLRNFSIKDVALSGESTFKESVSDGLVSKAERLEEDGDWDAALRVYKEAKKIQDKYGRVNSAICDLERKIDKYEDLIEKADRAYRSEEYFEAKSIYEEIERDLIVRSYTQQRIGAIQQRIQRYQRAFQEACRSKARAQSANEWKATKREFEAALDILPVDKKREVEREINYADSRIEAIYDQHISRGDGLYRQSQYVAAAKQYLDAIDVYERAAAQQKLQRSIEGKRKQLQNHYEPQRYQAKRQKDAAMEKAAQVIDANEEDCQLQRYERQKCIQAYYKDLIDHIPAEVDALVYRNKYYNKASLSCSRVSCTPSSNNNSTSARLFLSTAKRKHQRYNQYHEYDFKVYRDEYLEKALKMRPNYIDAHLFKAYLSNSIPDKIVIYKKVLGINPKHEQAAKLLQEWTEKFHHSVFDLIRNDEVAEIKKGIELGLMMEQHLYKNQNVVQFAINLDKASFLKLFLDNKKLLHNQVNWRVNALLGQSVQAKSYYCSKELLSKRSANPNHILANQESLLIQSIRNKTAKITDLLLTHQATATSKTKDNETALTLSLKLKELAVAKVLLNYLEVDEVDVTSVLITVIHKYSSVFEKMVNKGINLNMVDDQQRTLLHLAIAEHDFSIAKLLIDNGADVNFLDQHHDSPLLLTLKIKEKKIAVYLLSSNANINLKNKKGETALYWAIYNQLPKLSNLLLQQGGDYKRVFSLFRAKGNQQAIEALALNLAHYGLAHQQQQFIEDAVDQVPNIGFLSDNNASSPLAIAAQNQQNTLFWVLAKGNLHYTSTSQKSALHLAMDAHNSVLVKQLLADGSCNSMASKNGYSPFHYAIRKAYLEEANEILPYTVIDQQDHKGWTALHHAIDASQAETVKWLIRQGANPKAKNDNGENAKKFAKSQGKKYLKKLLKD